MKEDNQGPAVFFWYVWFPLPGKSKVKIYIQVTDNSRDYHISSIEENWSLPLKKKDT